MVDLLATVLSLRESREIIFMLDAAVVVVELPPAPEDDPQKR